MIEKPPKWRNLLTTDLLKKTLKSEELRKVVKHAQEKYAYWDIFKYYKFPKGINSKEAWAFLKFSHRLQQEETPVKAKRGEKFGFIITKTLYKKLNFIDIHTAGFIRSLAEKPTSVQREQLIISGLSEEAIASSQIEGANTSRKIAKEMIYSGRKPRNKDEQMIINNYQVMQQLDRWKDLDLNEEMLLKIQQKITNGTLKNSNESGRFRIDEDDIVISDSITGEIAFEPPKESEMRHELKRLIKYVNKEDADGEDFVHPMIKATIIHFWLAYLHPFVDGNGRTARALFYWYLQKKGYWLFQYLSVSRAIKTTKKQYDNAFLYSELDENDLTYFILYITDAVGKSISQLLDHYDKKVKEAERFKKVAAAFSDFNERQVALLSYLNKHTDSVIDIKTHQSKNGVAYETARKDLLGLKEKGLLVEIHRGNKKLYIPNANEINRIFKGL